MKKKQIIILSACGALLALLLTLLLLGWLAWGWFEERQTPYTPPTLEDGEAYYYMGSTAIKDVVLMYPQLTQSDLHQIRVHNTKGENYFFFHNKNGALDYFALGQTDNSAWTWESDDLYFPPILNEYSGTFDYTSLYDGTSTLPAMLAAVGTVVIDERIKPEDGVFDQQFLSKYGLSSADDPAYFELITYLRDGRGNYLFASLVDGSLLVGYDETDGKYYCITEAGTKGEEYPYGEETLTPAADTDSSTRVYVGNPTVDDTGYYLYLEGRNTVYTVSGGYLADVVERDMGYYVAPRAVIQSESSYANQLTPYFTIFHGSFTDEVGAPVEGGMTLGFTTDSIWTVDSDTTPHSGIWEYGKYTALDLSERDLNPLFAAYLVGRQVGDTLDMLLPAANLAETGKEVSYTLLRVEGIFDGDTYVKTGTVSDGDGVVISYTQPGALTGDGTRATLYGYVDLSRTDLPQELRDLLVGQTVMSDSYLNQTWTYTYGTAHPDLYTVTVQMEKIAGVKRPDGTSLKVVTYGSEVELSYVFLEEGKPLGSYDLTLKIPAEADFESDSAWVEAGYAEGTVYTMRTLARALIGKEVKSYLAGDGTSSLTVDIQYPIEYIEDFTLYDGATVEFATDYEEILSFAHTNSKSVFYGSGVYSILAPLDKTLYGLDGDAAYKVLQRFENLVGDETVDVGLDTEAMRKYGLYAYQVYYEMPRDCYSADNNGSSSFFYKSKIGFHLYISEVQPDGSRYVGSDQYDIVIRFDAGDTFDFVDWDFETSWVQNNLLLISYENLRGMVFDLNYAEEEYNHVWGFDVAVDRAYPYPKQTWKDGELVTTYDYMPRLFASLVDGGKGDGSALTYEELRAIFDYEVTTDTEDYSELPYNSQTHIQAGRYIQTISDNLRYIYELQNGRDLDAVYGNKNTFDTVNGDGTYYLRVLLFLLNSTRYWGAAADDLTEADIAALMADDANRTMTLALTLNDTAGKEYGYTLRFYNYSGHSLVSITDERAGGAESHYFYVQAREVNRIAEAVIALTQGQEIDVDSY